MFNHGLLNQIFQKLEISVPKEEDSINEFVNSFNFYKNGFSSDEYSLLITIREHKEGFGNRLMHSYSKPIQDLEIFVEICKTIGNNIIERLNRKSSQKFVALKRLHQKSSLISSEIVYLIKGGYASAALSRWRTLLETSIISLFLAQNNESLSERYLDYEIIERKKELEAYKKNFNLLGFEELSNDELQKIEKQYENVLEKYGKDFKKNYGWAFEILKQAKKPIGIHSFMDYLNLKYIEPFYMYSNNFIHSGSKSLIHNLGYIDGVLGDNTISSSSNIGFTDPAQLCMLSFYNSTLAFLIVSPNEQDLASLISLYNRINPIAEMFSEVENYLIEEELNN